MAIFLEAKGTFDGNCTAEGYEGCLVIDSFNFSVGRALSMEVGNCANREVSRPTLSEITLTKRADNSCTSLFKASTVTSEGFEAIIHFVQTGADKVEEYMTYKLTDCMVSGYAISAGGEDIAMETINLSFTGIEVNYMDFDKTNKGGSPQRVQYDLASAKGG